MAPPPQGQMRPSRYLFALAAIFVVLYRRRPRLRQRVAQGAPRAEAGPGPGRRHHDDARGPTTRTGARRRGPEPGAGPRRSSRTGSTRLGVAEAEVVTEGNSHIVISVPGQNNDIDPPGRRPGCSCASARSSGPPATSPVAPTPRRRRRAPPGPERLAEPERRDRRRRPRRRRPRRHRDYARRGRLPIADRRAAARARGGPDQARRRGHGRLRLRPDAIRRRPELAHLRPGHASRSSSRSATLTPAEVAVLPVQHAVQRPADHLREAQQAPGRLDREHRPSRRSPARTRQRQVPARRGQGRRAPTSRTPRRTSTPPRAQWKVDLTFNSSGAEQVDRR